MEASTSPDVDTVALPPTPPDPMAANTTGIQTLLDAEKEAAKIVAKAREYRNQRVKDARKEAASEIQAYSASKQQEFDAFQDGRKGDSDTLQGKLDGETEENLAKIRQSFGDNKQQVVDKLLERVIDVNPELHKNYKKVAA